MTDNRLKLASTAYYFVAKLPFIPLLILIGTLLCSASCTDPTVPETPLEEQEEQLVPITFGVSIEGYDDVNSGLTKSLDPSLSDENVDRLDIFSWNSDGTPAGHLTFLPEEGEDLLDLSSVTPIFHAGKNVRRTYLAVANLDPDSADYLEGLSSDDMVAYPTRVIPWSAGNCRPGTPIMAGTAAVTFGSTKTVQFSLRKYECKIELGTITLAIPDMSQRDMKVTKIALTNGWDMLRLCMKAPASFIGDPSDILGERCFSNRNLGTDGEEGYYASNVFANKLEKEELELVDRFVFREKFSLADYGGKGKLLSEYYRVYNHNYMTQMNTMYLTDDPALREVSVHEFQSYLGEGVLSTSDGSVYSPLTVNRTFHTLPTHYAVFSEYNEPVDLPSDQQYFHRLVIEVEMNGTKYYYPIILDGLLPGRHYVIRNITLRGEPSLFCNTWVKTWVPSLSSSSVDESAKKGGSAGSDIGTVALSSLSSHEPSHSISANIPIVRIHEGRNNFASSSLIEIPDIEIGGMDEGNVAGRSEDAERNNDLTPSGMTGPGAEGESAASGKGTHSGGTHHKREKFNPVINMKEVPGND